MSGAGALLGGAGTYRDSAGLEMVAVRSPAYGSQQGLTAAGVPDEADGNPGAPHKPRPPGHARPTCSMTAQAVSYSPKYRALYAPMAAAETPKPRYSEGRPPWR